ncbi:MAG: hypothetical protein C4326_13190 [Ignavibacteria bacterium]
MMQQFLTLSPDEEADTLTTLAKLQAYDPNDPGETGYMFVYPIGQTFWDTKKRILSNGMSLYEFIRDTLLPQYNPLTGVNIEGKSGLPHQFELKQNDPNPFNPATTICFSLPHREYVTLKVFDLLGREVATLVDGELNPGVHSLVFDAKDLPSGVYFYRLTTTTSRLVGTKVMVLMK